MTADLTFQLIRPAVAELVANRREVAERLERAQQLCAEHPEILAATERLRPMMRSHYLGIMPGAYAGSVCGRSLSGNPSSTIGFEKQFNKGFQIESEGDFVAYMTKDIPPAPPQATELRAINPVTSEAAA